MRFFTQLNDFLADDRLLVHLIALHLLLGSILLVSILVRRLLERGSHQLVRLAGFRWLANLGHEANRRIRTVVFWTTLGLMVAAVIAAAGYHGSGRDVRADFASWYRHLTRAELLQLALGLGEAIALMITCTVAVRQLRRLRRYAEARTQVLLAKHLGERHNDQPDSITHSRHEDTVRRWFLLLERFALLALSLGALWCAGHIVHLGSGIDRVVGFLIRVLTILMVARLLTLGCRTLSSALASLGNRTLAHTKFQRYWERVTRLFTFGEKCFEAAVYISAASLAIRELQFIDFIADFGPRIVVCIGIFFATRVLIELIQVLLNEAFGIYQEDTAVDQKGQTLVPLLQSISQYVLYFGAAVMMLGVLGIDTRPILAGAGILGLAGGLGAQSLVTDVVSGFFILFENQYLVGDLVQIGDAFGKVEAVSIRHTQIRDEQGKLYIIPNGQVKTVVNYSKGFVNAVVDIKLPTTHSLESVMADLAEAGKRLRQSRREVLGDTIIKGLIDLTPNDMTIRAVTKVQPGAHQAMQNEYRRILKDLFDKRKTGYVTAEVA